MEPRRRDMSRERTKSEAKARTRKSTALTWRRPRRESTAKAVKPRRRATRHRRHSKAQPRLGRPDGAHRNDVVTKHSQGWETPTTHDETAPANRKQSRSLRNHQKRADAHRRWGTNTLEIFRTSSLTIWRSKKTHLVFSENTFKKQHTLTPEPDISLSRTQTNYNHWSWKLIRTTPF